MGSPVARLAPLVRRCAEALAAQGAGRPLDGAGVDAVVRLIARAMEWNARIDLTAARDDAEWVDLYLADALVLATTAPERGPAWVDVGSGGGAPALALAIARPDLALTLVEPRGRRAAFLRLTAAELGLGRVQVVGARSDTLPADAFHVACSRATFPPADWAREGLRLAPAAWLLLARERPELSAAAVVQRVDYRWPGTGVERAAWLLERREGAPAAPPA